MILMTLIHFLQVHYSVLRTMLMLHVHVQTPVEQVKTICVCDRKASTACKRFIEIIKVEAREVSKKPSPINDILTHITIPWI